MLLSRPKKIIYKNNNEIKKAKYTIEDSVCVSELGRVEAVRVSPNLKNIAYASFDNNEIVVLSVEIKKEIKINKINKIKCELNGPHDLNWIDDSTIVVANRNGPSIIVDILNKKIKAKLENKILNKTNSVAVLKKNDKIRLLFCNIFHYISYCDLDMNYQIIEEGILLKEKMKVPDGIAISPSTKKIAITSALTNQILICNDNFDVKKILKSERPHSVDFIDDKNLISTGGNDPFLNIWDLNKKTHHKYRGLSKKEFALRGSNTEGGIKGIDYCPIKKLLFATCPNSPFLIFKL